MALTAIGRGLTRLRTGYGLRTASASNFATHVLAVLASLATFRLMIALTDMPTVGLWAMIMGFAIMAAVAEMGLGANLTRFVAARPDISRRLLFRLAAVGAILSLLPTVVIALIAAWPIYIFAVTRPGLPVDVAVVATLTGLALAATVGNVANATFCGLAEGIGRLALRSAALFLSTVVTLVGLWPAVAAMGPIGIGVANLAGVLVQLGTVLAVLFVAARRLPRSGDEETVPALLRLLFASTVQNLGVMLARATIEPVARFFVALAGSLSFQAVFELALRVAIQFRWVVQNSLQPLLYVGASDQQALATRFERPRAFIVRLSALMFLALACLSPLISAVVLGQIEPAFIVLIVVLGAGSALAINGYPGLYAITARGEFASLLALTVAIAVVNAVLVSLGVWVDGPMGSVAGLAAGYAVSGLVFQHYLARLSGQSLWSQFGGFWPGTVLAAVVGVALALAAFRFPPATVLVLAAVSCALLIAPFLSLARTFLASSR
jgi:O-antigen/teichoic acid export membrane protein